MSSAHEIAIVTSALALLIQEDIGPALSGAEAVCGHPRDFESRGKKAGVNLFLYQVAPNPAWRNSEVSILRRDKDRPEDRAKEKAVRVPVIPLNLYYVISFYGDERAFEPHRLLSVTMRALHEAPARLPAHLARATGDFSPQEPEPGSDEDLEQRVRRIEPLKLNPVQLNLEELSKLWSVFFQVPYALSVAYEASVVLLPMLAPRWRPVATAVAVNERDGEPGADLWRPGPRPLRGDTP